MTATRLPRHLSKRRLVRGPGRFSCAMLAASLLLVTGCGESQPEPAAQAAITAAVDAQSVVSDPDEGPGVLHAEEEVLDAALLALTLEQLLGDHVLQISGAAVSRADGLETDAALAVLNDNTDALVDAIQLVYGGVGADAFSSLWTQHIAFLLDHAHGRAQGDTDAMLAAEEHLGHYENGFGSFAQTATNGALPADVVADLLSVHVADINGYVELVLDEEPAAAARALIAGHDHAADIGAAIATAIAGQGPRAFPTTLDDETVAVASELARALAAHVMFRASGADVDGDLAATVSARVEAALGAAASDSDTARGHWRALLAGDGDDTIAASVALADALGAREAAAGLRRVANGPRHTSHGPGLSEAHAAAFAVAMAWSSSN